VGEALQLWMLGIQTATSTINRMGEWFINRLLSPSFQAFIPSRCALFIRIPKQVSVPTKSIMASSVLFPNIP
jgi:hypothetical protein